MENLQPCYLFCQIVYLLVFFITFSQQMTNSAYASSLTEGSYFFYQHSEYPRDCQEILSQCSASNAVTSGVYLIKPDGYSQPFGVFCDNSIESGGWTVIQRRMDGAVDFNRNWVEYTEGFGFLSSEFWLGNQKVSFLANQKTYELQIDIVNAAGSSFYVHYDVFRISDDWGQFKLAGLGEYSGNASNVPFYCPTNTEYGSCSCQALCSDRSGCQKDCNDGEETCICPNGFFLDQDSNCVNEHECACYVEGFGVVQDGDSYVPSDCSRRCSCNNNQLNCVNLQCSTDATCMEIGGVHKCQCNEGFEGDGQTCTILTTTTPPTMSDCLDLHNAGITADGVYTINPSGSPGSEFQVYCDMTTDGGGWTVFQRRVDGSTDFYQDWATYKAGFGPPSGDHWLGNDKIHTITSPKDYQLRIDIVNSGGSSYHSLYNPFRISDESDNYRLSLGSYSGTAAFRFYDSRDSVFSTHDRDNDKSATYNCAEKHQSGWWYDYNPDGLSSYRAVCRFWPAGRTYRYCTSVNLNGASSGGNGENIFWVDIPGIDCNIRQTEMKIRPV